MIGNDVVDLRDPEARPDAIHSRFDERVFGAEEQDHLRRCDRPDIERWRLWAAKESAFKAARRATPGLVFAPSKFCVDVEGESEGRVTIGERSYEVSWRSEDDCVHAVAWEPAVPAREVISAASRCGSEEPSDAARRLAIATVAAALGVAPGSVRVESAGRVPTLRIGAERRLALSLSHHGAVVAFAAYEAGR
jgi:phosphopantetheinyl transferase (holo-ACP synthase)